METFDSNKMENVLMTKSKKDINRREFLSNSLKVGAGMAVAGSGIISSSVIAESSTKLAPGKIGGPVGFPGAERYQYGPESAAGRAIMALKELRAAGKAPKKLVFMIQPGCAGHWESGFPKGTKSAKEIIFEETGIEIETVGVVTDDMTTKIIQDYQTGGGKYDIYAYWSNELADIAAAGALHKLDDFAEQYKPDWLDPQLGLIGGEATLTSTSKVYGNIYNVVMDGDTQLFYYRKDLMEDPKEQRAFKARYGWDLQPAKTWEQWDQIGEFFHRPEQNLLGNTCLMNRYWGHLNWYMRYTSFGNPNRYYFDENTGEPLINSEEGVKATLEHVNSLKYHHKDGLSWGWPEQYSNFGAGGAATTVAVANLSKFLDNKSNPDTKNIHGKLYSALAPGRVINGNLIRRPVWYPHVGHGVSSSTKYAEAAYLVLQWASDGMVSSWLTANPAGYYDPCRVPHLSDPLLVEKYHPYNIASEKVSMLRCTPPLVIPGVVQFQTALDVNLQEAGAGRITAEQAMEKTAKAWKKTIRRIGEKRHIEAVKSSRPGWPTIVDQPS
jgi:multiple sugar transport system substrate-binding protein